MRNLLDLLRMNDLKNKVRMPTRGIFYAPLFARLGYYSFQFGFLTWDKYAASLDGAQNIPPSVVFHAKKDRATNANAHLAHLQALTHKPMLQLAKEPNFCRRTSLSYKE